MNSSGEAELFQKKIHIEQYDNRDCFLQTENSSNRENLVLLGDFFFLSLSLCQSSFVSYLLKEKALKPAEMIYSLVL